jgi:hypothetical protein
MAAELTRLTHKIAIQLHLVADSWTVCCSRSRRSVRKRLDTPSCQTETDVAESCLRNYATQLLKKLPAFYGTQNFVSCALKYVCFTRSWWWWWSVCSTGGMIGRGNRNRLPKGNPTPMSLSSSEIPHGLSWNWTRSTASRSHSWPEINTNRIKLCGLKAACSGLNLFYQCWFFRFLCDLILYSKLGSWCRC